MTVFSPAPRKHYLSITPDNIVTVYPSPTTAPQARKTIVCYLYYVQPLFVNFSIEIVVSSQCLTEVEKRFGNPASTEENCVSNAHPCPNHQPPAPFVAALNVQPVDSRSTSGPMIQYGVNNSQTSLEAAPPDHHTDRDIQQSTHQYAHSIFSNQLCEGEDEYSTIHLQ